MGGVWGCGLILCPPPSEVTHTHHSCTMFYVPFSKPFIVIDTSLCQNLLAWFCYTHVPPLTHTQHTHTPPTHTLQTLRTFLPTHSPIPLHTHTPLPTPTTHPHTHTHSLHTLVSHTSLQSLMMGEMCSQDHFLTNSRRQTQPDH